MTDSFRLHYVKGEGVLFSQEEWLASISSYRAKYADKELETMVQLLVAILVHPEKRGHIPDDRVLFAAALRSRHNESHYRRMLEEFKKNLSLVAGTKLNDFILKHLSENFVNATPRSPVVLSDIQAFVDSIDLSYYGTPPRDDEFEIIDETPEVSDEVPFEALVDFLEKNRLRLVDLFRSFDKDGSGSITKKELRHGLESSGINIKAEFIDALIDFLDSNGDGEIDYKEFASGRHFIVASRRFLGATSKMDPPPTDADGRKSPLAGFDRSLTVQNGGEEEMRRFLAMDRLLTPASTGKRDDGPKPEKLSFSPEVFADLVLHCHYVTRP